MKKYEVKLKNMVKEKAERKHLTAQNCIDDEKEMYVKFGPIELEQLVSKKVIEAEDKTYTILSKICSELGIDVHESSRGGGSAVKELKEKYGLTASQLAKKIVADPELLKKITK